MIKITEIDYNSWGKCIRLATEKIELIVTVSCGPRIVRYGFIDGINMLFEDVEKKDYRTDPVLEKRFGEGSVWYNGGGHRLWTSPEEFPRTYYPDNEECAYEIIDNGVLITPAEQVWTNIAMQIKIVMSKDGKVSLEHTIKNTGAWPIEIAAWALTVLNQGGKEIVPMPTRDTGLLPNRVLGIWPYTKMTDKRMKFFDKFITIAQDVCADGPLKIGINSEHGYAAYLLQNNLFIKRFETQTDGNYPDGGMSFETYTNAVICEMETLSTLQKISHGESIIHNETWELAENVCADLETEKGIEELVKKYIVK